MSSDENESDKNDSDKGNDDADYLNYWHGYSHGHRDGYDKGNIIIAIIIIIIIIIIITRLFGRRVHGLLWRRIWLRFVGLRISFWNGLRSWIICPPSPLRQKSDKYKYKYKYKYGKPSDNKDKQSDTDKVNSVTVYYDTDTTEDELEVISDTQRHMIWYVLSQFNANVCTCSPMFALF